MTADRLRRAAEVLRGEVDEAQCKCGGPACGPEKWFKRDELLSRFDGSEKAVPLLLTMNPSVVLAMADWLDATAAEHEVDSGNAHVDEFLRAFNTAPDLAAITLANRILGDDA